MKIRLNGEEREVDDGWSVAALLESMDLRRDGIAVAVDKQVVPRGDHERTALREGADVEVIRAVGGG